MRLPHLLCMLATVAALATAGCGSDDEPEGKKLPASVSTALLPQLESIGDRVAAGVSGACDDIYSEDAGVGNFAPIDAELATIPSDVDPEIRTALEQSIERLKQLVGEECDQIRAEEQGQETDTTTTETETVTTETETVPADTTETNTTPTETTPTTPTTPEETPPGGAEAPQDDG